MANLKFNIGDVISSKPLDPSISELVLIIEDIIFQEETIYKTWFGQSNHGLRISNSYIGKEINNSWYYYIHFNWEDEYEFYTEVIPLPKTLNSSPSSCPKCNGKLTDCYSDWAGKDIKKCKACGWC